MCVVLGKLLCRLEAQSRAGSHNDEPDAQRCRQEEGMPVICGRTMSSNTLGVRKSKCSYVFPFRSGILSTVHIEEVIVALPTIDRRRLEQVNVLAGCSPPTTLTKRTPVRDLANMTLLRLKWFGDNGPQIDPARFHRKGSCPSWHSNLVCFASDRARLSFVHAEHAQSSGPQGGSSCACVRSRWIENAMHAMLRFHVAG
jgi:hypothetical protein